MPSRILKDDVWLALGAVEGFVLSVELGIIPDTATCEAVREAVDLIASELGKTERATFTPVPGLKDAVVPIKAKTLPRFTLYDDGDEWVCPYCGEETRRCFYTGVDLCEDHGVVEGETMTRREYEAREAAEEVAASQRLEDRLREEVEVEALGWHELLKAPEDGPWGAPDA